MKKMVCLVVAGAALLLLAGASAPAASPLDLLEDVAAKSMMGSGRALAVGCAPYVAPVNYGRSHAHYGHYEYATYSRYPSYLVGSVGYSPPADPALGEVSKELVGLVKDLLRENRELRGGGGPLGLRADPPHFQTARESCAKCHSGDGAKGGFNMFGADGRLRDMTPEERGKIIVRLSTDDPSIKMPPGKDSMTPDGRLKFIAGLTTPREPAPIRAEVKPMLDPK